jgi:hypothetical protein
MNVSQNVPTQPSHPLPADIDVDLVRIRVRSSPIIMDSNQLQLQMQQPYMGGCKILRCLLSVSGRTTDTNTRSRLLCLIAKQTAEWEVVS